MQGVLEKMPDLRDEVLALPVDVKLMLNGDARADFLNHQKGKAVDKAHLFSLSVRAQDAPKDQEFAWQVARLLLTGQDGPFHNSIRLDSKAMQGIPVSTLCASGSTDQGTSLVGLAKLALANGRSPEWAAGIVTLVHGHLKDRAPELLEPGRALAPPRTTAAGRPPCWSGCPWRRLLAEPPGRGRAGEDLVEALVFAAKAAGFDREVGGEGAVRPGQAVPAERILLLPLPRLGRHDRGGAGRPPGGPRPLRLRRQACPKAKTAAN
jgi:hypothetical protein